MRLNEYSMNVEHEFGKHYLIELLECTQSALERVSNIERIMLYAAEASLMTVLDRSFTQYSPWGVSGILFLAESHFAIHTWPEARYAGADIFTCGKSMEPEKAIEVLKERLGAKEVRVSVISRGF